MGNDYSTYLSEIKQLPPNVCVMHVVAGSFYGINLSDEIITAMQDTYRVIWENEMEVELHCVSIIKLKPHIQIMFHSDDAIKSAKTKQMLCRFLKNFSNFGWSLLTSPTLTFEGSLSTWLFYKQINPQMITDRREFCVMGLSRYDRFQFVDFPKELENPILDCIRANWKKGIQNIEIENTENSWAVKLKGNPWSGFGEDSLEGRSLILCLIKFMCQHNWRLANSTAMKPDACDTMLFCHFPYSMEYPEPIEESYFILALLDINCFTIIGGDQMITDTIAGSCSQHIPKGLRGVESKYNYPTVETVTHVWSARNEKEMETKKLITLLFQDLAAIGWIPIESIDCSRQIQDMSSIVFYRVPPVRMMFFCLCPRKYQSICLINAIFEVQAVVLNTFTEYYAIKRELIKSSSYGVAHSISFEGDPFRVNIQGTVIFQVALAAIISALRDIGWNLVLSADTSDEVLKRSKQADVKWSIYGLWFSKILI